MTDSGCLPSVGAMVEATAEDLAAAGVEMPRLEAQLLVAQVLGWSRLQVMTRPEHRIVEEYEEALGRLSSARRRRAPLAYLIGRREFYGFEFSVGPGVLAPRPETELLVDLALEEARRRGAVRMADVCTGSGCVAVALAAALPGSRVLATDVSQAALACAARNAAEQGVSGRVGLVRGHLALPLRSGWAEILVANPPYVPSSVASALQPEVACYEPWLALDGGASGLAIFEELALGARRALEPGGLFASEIGYDQGAAAITLLRDAGFADIVIVRDLAGLDRVVTGRA